MKRFFLRGTLFFALCVIAQVIFSSTIAPFIPFGVGLPVLSVLQRQLHAQAKVLYFGDSVIDSFAPSDMDRSSIAQFIQQAIPGITVGDVSSPAYQQRVFAAMMSFIASSPTKPHTVILPINLRSFSPSWNMAPNDQFENEIFFFSHPFLAHFAKPLAVFRAVKTSHITMDAFNQSPVYRGEQKVGTVQDFISLPDSDTAKLQKTFAFYYMYNLHPSDSLMQTLSITTDIAKKAGVHLLVYITPIDYQAGVTAVGPEFANQVRKNTAIICDFFQRAGVTCLDLSQSLDSKAFHYDGNPNEHLTERGRRFVAGELVKVLKH